MDICLQRKIVALNMDNEELAKWIGDEIRQAKVKSADWRRNARECYAFYAGKQWSDEDSSKLEIEGRPAVVFNRTARTINAIAGLEVQNRQEVRYIPRGTEDAPVNDLLTGAAKWVMDNCDAQDEESESFQDTLIAGMGWTDTSLDYETNPDGMIIVERDDPLIYSQVQRRYLKLYLESWRRFAPSTPMRGERKLLKVESKKFPMKIWYRKKKPCWS